MGACCIFPFIYRGSPQHRCTRAERGYRWCSSTSDYDKDKLWGFCAACFLSHGGNSNGNCCHFPFVYKGTIHPTCTTHDASKPWCATTYNYDIDKQWGYCGGKVKNSTITLLVICINTEKLKGTASFSQDGKLSHKSSKGQPQPVCFTRCFCYFFLATQNWVSKTHATLMGIKIAVPFANIFIAKRYYRLEHD